jgi:hypothetical protein
MTAKEAKKLRRQYKKTINGMANVDLRKEIFRLARNRDILGLLLIAAALVIIALLALLLKRW